MSVLGKVIVIDLLREIVSDEKEVYLRYNQGISHYI